MKRPKAKTGQQASSVSARKATSSRAVEVKPAKGNSAEGRRLSALDAAAQVLKNAGKPMRSREMINVMSEQGLWVSPGGKTPWATLHAAVTREITLKGKESRFRKVGRGQFAFND